MIPPADLTITITTGSHGPRVILRTANGSEQEFELSPAKADRLRELRKSLSERLEPCHDRIVALADDVPRFETLYEVIYDLRAIGGQFVWLFRENESDGQRWDEVLSKALLLSPDQRRDQPARIVLEVDESQTDLLSLPIEILPIMDPRWVLQGDRKVVDEETLYRALLLFPAFAAVVTRRVKRAIGQSQELLRAAEGKVPVKVIRDKSFYANVDDPVRVSEVEWLREQRAIFDVETPWPDAKMDLDVVRETIGTCLLHPATQLTNLAASRTWSDQIQHFSCHYTTTKTDHTLGLAPGLGLAISQLHLYCADRRNLMRPPADHRPLVFLNACGSIGPAVHGGPSLVDLLVNIIEPRAIIATLTPVHFPLASRFARLVYQSLMEGVPLGEAMRQARWSLVEPGRNLFGILYVMAGNPDLYIVPTPNRVASLV